MSPFLIALATSSGLAPLVIVPPMAFLIRVTWFCESSPSAASPLSTGTPTMRMPALRSAVMVSVRVCPSAGLVRTGLGSWLEASPMRTTIRLLPRKAILPVATSNSALTQSSGVSQPPLADRASTLACTSGMLAVMFWFTVKKSGSQIVSVSPSPPGWIDPSL